MLTGWVRGVPEINRNIFNFNCNCKMSLLTVSVTVTKAIQQLKPQWNIYMHINVKFCCEGIFYLLESE